MAMTLDMTKLTSAQQAQLNKAVMEGTDTALLAQWQQSNPGLFSGSSTASTPSPMPSSLPSNFLPSFGMVPPEMTAQTTTVPTSPLLSTPGTIGPTRPTRGDNVGWDAATPAQLSPLSPADAFMAAMNKLSPPPLGPAFNTMSTQGPASLGLSSPYPQNYYNFQIMPSMAPTAAMQAQQTPSITSQQMDEMRAASVPTLMSSLNAGITPRVSSASGNALSGWGSQLGQGWMNQASGDVMNYLNKPLAMPGLPTGK
jgi:hypothetical protein